MAVIEVEGLRKTYKRFRRPPQNAVNGLDLTVEEGGVFGFLGPNGSGKTTTIRLLLGLVNSDSGQLRLLDQPVPSGLPAVLPQIGALVEAPVFFPGISARRNLQLLAGVAGLPKRRVDEVLETVALTDRARDRVKGYSLGMKQRLGIAAALLKEPRLLVLDEPSNGLDPAGIREVRELLKRLGGTGTTVFVSSHLLAEVQQVCDRVAIINHGQLVTTGSVREIIESTRADTVDVLVRVPDLPAADAVLRTEGLTLHAGGDHFIVIGVDDPGRVTHLLANAGHYVTELMPIAPDLETVFLKLTAGAKP